MSLVLTLAVVPLLVLVTAFAVAARVSLSVAARERLEALEREGSTGAARALAMVREPDLLLDVGQLVMSAAAITIGWRIGIAADAVHRSAARSSSDMAASVVAVVVALAATIVCGMVVRVAGETTPRALALAAPEAVAARTAGPYRVVVAVLGPIAAGLGRVAAALLRFVGVRIPRGEGRAHTAAELVMAVAEGLDRGVGAGVGNGGGSILGALGFLDVRVAEVMTPRSDLVTVPRTSTIARAEQLVHRSGHSRVLVVDDRGEVTGFLHAKDLIALDPGDRSQLLPPGLVRVALRVSPTDRLEEVLPRMRRARRHVAVVGAPGEVVGLITLEDIQTVIVRDLQAVRSFGEGSGSGNDDGGTEPLP